MTFYTAIPTLKPDNFSEVATFVKSIPYPPAHKTHFMTIVKPM